MTVEFTGERVVPGQVDADLWNEHLARYAFASRFCAGQRVIDIGCGTGYGANLLAQTASSVVGLDFAVDALEYARTNFHQSLWVVASATSIPFADHSFDVSVSFEVIEHLAAYKELVREAARVLKPGGIFVVSTPNQTFYAESREKSGPNPFHEREFTLAEFREILRSSFAHVTVLFENHTAGVLIESPDPLAGSTSHIEGSSDPEQANYFVAVCSNASLPAIPSYVHLPKAANVLKERADHIHFLEAEVRTKDGWLETAQREHRHLLDVHADTLEELKRSNAWAKDLDEKLKAAGERIVALQDEFDEHQRSAMQVAEAYQRQVDTLHAELESRTQWAKSVVENHENELQTQMAELAKCVQLLDTAEATVIERTNWALDLQKQLDALQTKINIARASKWVKVARILKIGPEFDL